MNGYSLNDLAVVRSHLSQLAIRQLPRFPGPEPGRKQRRDYVEGFLSQCFPRENPEETKRLLRKDATIIAANLLIKGGTRIVYVSRFEWETDKVFWDLWFLGLPPQSKPAWPWSRPPVPGFAETPSIVFSSLRYDHDRDGGLNINRASVPEEGEDPLAPPEIESTSIQVMEWNGMHYPLPAPVPTLRGRRKAWATLYPGVTPHDPELPFTLALPSIRERLFGEHVEVAWRYDERVEGDEVNVECPIDTGKLPETAHALVVGPVVPQAEARDPINSEGVGRVWADIRNWYLACTSGQLTTMRSYLENMAEGRKGSGVHTIPGLPDGFKEVQSRTKQERKACEEAITTILDNRGITVRIYGILKDWALSRKEGICLDVAERVNLAADLWRKRALTPEMGFQISELIGTMKRDVKAELLRNSMLPSIRNSGNTLANEPLDDAIIIGKDALQSTHANRRLAPWPAENPNLTTVPMLRKWQLIFAMTTVAGTGRDDQQEQSALAGGGSDASSWKFFSDQDESQTV
ncbi:hypothetical protein FNAPI_8511 [Fusarium napiforme]|uniref:Uncharacterized protein n=1 Tax=Fusarium napiforme TaxID=42672 RepID=A0A8H5J277_9HYPO|nr:hypothetical protein FNAPI_8511 [Fusarium napiforme]